ncbi:UDP-glucose 4-epimerase GalE [Caloranaerobacter azorensis]|uniref:UDP-glucose 4-epimerase n=1 Tax=Caloranaerobacter azorensis TaxID=116090 RepID=A0A6P1YEI8_9FIRM|nr:UDP-glucose 4-epimerase GalE [Caloranaerobacter azorensis]QIB27574.1 UDP-glucose 4-epimerase GalE [Caloranaerobacter azorensis]
MNILVTGGAGYIGSHVVRELIGTKNNVVVFDNLQKGHRDAIKGVTFVEGDLNNKELLDKTMKKYDIDSVIHLAADSLVGESMENPSKYYTNNVCSGLNLLNSMVENNVKYIVFSSTAAVYGEPKSIPITEDNETKPTNVYGETKLMFESILKRYDEAYGIKYMSLRYFNAAGAHISGEIGEDHNPETHLIPIIMQVALGQREKIFIFGDDYDTKDGTCIRDYIHVTDLANAHILALEALESENKSNIYNLGNGEGFSVREVIDMVEKVTGKSINREVSGRRPGDPAVLIASSEKIIKELGWKPRFDSLEKIIETAWKWHSNNPKGYDE